MSRRKLALQDLPYFATLIGSLAAFHYYIISGRRHFPFDYAAYHFPLLYYARHWLAQGVLPFYDSYVYSGMPFYTNLQAALFYPPHLVLYLFSAAMTSELTGYQIQYLNLAHFAFAGAGFYALLRHYQISRWTSLVGAWLLIFNGHVLSQSQHLGVIETFAWIPWSLLALERVVRKPAPTAIALLAWCLAMPILIGFLPQAVATYLILAVAALFRLARRTGEPRLPALAALSTSGLIAVSLGAIVLVPLLFQMGDWIPLSPQSSMPLAQLWTMIAPNIFNEFNVSNYMGPAGLTLDYHYAGAAVIPLALMGAWRQSRRVWMFILIGAISLLITFGPGWLIVALQHLPIVGAMIRPLNFAYFFVLSLLILAMHGLDDPELRPFVLPASALMMALGMAVFAVVRGPVFEDLWMMGRLLLLIVVLATIVAVRPGRWQKFAIGLMILVELFEVHRGRPSWAFAGNPNAYTSTTMDSRHSDLLAAMRASELVPHRVAVKQQQLSVAWDGMWRVWGIESISGFEPQISRKYWKAVQENLSTWSSDRTFTPGKLDSDLYSLLNVRYFLTDEDVNHPDWEFVARDDHLKVFRRKEFHPRYALVDSSAVTKNENNFSAVYKPVREFSGDVTVLEYRPGHVSLALQAPPDGAFLFISERSYPQWRAEVDGVEARLWEVNDILLGLPVAKGEHRVVLRFVPQEFPFAAGVSAVGFVSTLILAVVAWRQKKA